MNILIKLVFFVILCTQGLTAYEAEENRYLYAKSTEYAASGKGYVHIGNYADFRIFTDVSFDDFGDQTINTYTGEMLYTSENSAHVFYPYFYILVNYYHTFEVLTVSPWDFDGIGALTNVNKQYIEFYE